MEELTKGKTSQPKTKNAKSISRQQKTLQTKERILKGAWQTLLFLVRLFLFWLCGEYSFGFMRRRRRRRTWMMERREK